jgi:putative colanic acid biosynthesis UDP-glucose lipid carrier transferase
MEQVARTKAGQRALTELHPVGVPVLVLPRLPQFPLEKNFNRLVKRSFDIIGSTFLLLFVLSWLTPLLAILIRLDSKGPIFFRQNRIGRDGKVFSCLKFRTMIVNGEADELPAHHNDRRITSIGHLLRKNHLDEWPQLLQVWWGDMSLVGPRPYMVTDNERYADLIENYGLRHSVKPGITGLAQSSGHFGYLLNHDEMKERVALDLVYVRNWSLRMDIRIICRTLMMVFPKQATT